MKTHRVKTTRRIYALVLLLSMTLFLSYCSEDQFDRPVAKTGTLSASGSNPALVSDPDVRWFIKSIQRSGRPGQDQSDYSFSRLKETEIDAVLDLLKRIRHENYQTANAGDITAYSTFDIHLKIFFRARTDLLDGSPVVPAPLNEALNGAIKHGNLKNLQRYIEAGADVNRKGKYLGRAPLHLAAFYGNKGRVSRLDIVKELVGSEGIDLNARDELGLTALHLAASIGWLDIYQYLVGGEGIQIKVQDSVARTPLHLAAEGGHFEVVKDLMRKDPSLKDMVNEKGETAEDRARVYRHKDVADWLANFVVKPTFVCLDGMLLKAVVSQDLVRVKECLDTGADPNRVTTYGSSYLYTAARLGNRGIVKALVDAGSDINRVDIGGGTPLHVAALSGHFKVVKYLAERPGINLNAKTLDQSTPLHYASTNGHFEIVKYLVKRPGIELNVKTIKFGNTFLHHILTRLQKDKARSRKMIEILKEVPEIQVEIQNVWRQNALHHAAYYGHVNIVKYLMERDPELTTVQDSWGNTPLHRAVSDGGNFEVVKYLVRKEPTLKNIRNRDGYTPEQLARVIGRRADLKNWQGIHKR